MSSQKKPFVLLLFPGPQYRLRDLFEERLTGLSQTFDGALITVGPEPGPIQIGSFTIHTVKDKRGLVPTLVSFVRCIHRVVAERKRDGGIQLIVTYDPLKTGLLGLIARFLSGGKLLCEVNGDYANPANYSDIPNRAVRHLKRHGYVRLERFVLARAAGIKLLYPKQLEQLRFRPRGTQIVRAFPQFVRTAQFKPIEADRVVLTVGFPAHVKGVDVLIEAFDSIAAEFPSWRLKVLGHYPDRDEVARLIGSAPRVEFHRAVPRAEMPEHIGRCGIFVLASRTEGMGRVLVEAMAAGRARIGTRVGGIPTVIEDGVDGLLVPPGDANALAEALRRLMRDDALRHELGTRALQRAKAEFSEQAYFRRTAELYFEVIRAS